MDLASLISAFSALVVAIFFGLDKVISFLKFKKNKKNYESALYVHKYVIRNWSKHQYIDAYKDTIKRIIISENDIASEESIKNAYSHLLEEYKNIDIGEVKQKIDDYYLMSAYFKSAIGPSANRFTNIPFIFFGSGLLSSLLQNILSATDKSALDRSTIVGMLVGRKIKQDTKSYIYLLIGLLVHISLYFFGVTDINIYLITGLIFLVGALSVNQKITEYRIRKGYYGSTPYEVREIIKYIEEHSDPNDFSDGDGKKALFQDAEESAEREEIVYGGVYQ